MKNFILYDKANHYHWKGCGQLSLKTFSNDMAQYKAGRRRYKISDHQMLILNEGTDYELNIVVQQITFNLINLIKL